MAETRSRTKPKAPASQEKPDPDEKPEAPPAEKSEDSQKSEPSKDGDQEKDGGQEEGNQKDGEKEKSFRPSKKAIVIGSIIFVVLLIGILLYWLHARQFISTDDAYTEGHVHQVSSRVAGIVTQVEVDDNEHVEAGQTLVTLDPRDYQVEAQRARAGLAQAHAQVGTEEAKITQANAQILAANAQIKQAAAQVTQALAQLEKAQLDFDRANGLYLQDKRAVSKSDIDANRAALDSSRGMVEAARANQDAATANAESAKANTTAAQAQLQVAHANVTAAQAAVDNADLQLSYCNVVSPVRGKVARKTVETGQQLSPGQALLAVVPENVWIVANLKETQLTDVRVGQRVNVKIDAMPDREFIGTVDSIQEGAGAVFSLLPPDNATGNFTKIVQRVPVKIIFDQESIRDFRERIVPGLSVLPKIDLESLKDNKREPAREKKIQKQNQEVEAGK